MRKVLFLAAMLGTVGLARFSSAATVGTGSNAGSITVNANGTLTVVNPAAGVAGTYDGTEDVAYNVYNNSNGALTGLTVSGTGISHFDGDGIDHYADASGAEIGTNYGHVVTGAVPGVSDYTGYSSDNLSANVYTSYTPDSTGSGADTVVIQFGGGGIAASGGTGFISFEFPGAASGDQLTVSASSAPLPASASVGLVLLLGLGTFALLKKRHPAAN